MEALKFHREYEYSLITNNCEHFATFMKLKVNWSAQVNNGFTITTKVGQNMVRPITLILDGVETGTQISSFATKSTGLLSFFTAAPAPVMSTLAKASVIRAPITIGIDIASLVYAYEEENESIQICTKAIADLKKTKSYWTERALLYKNIKILCEKERKLLEALKSEEERKRIEALKLEEEQKRLEALKIEEERRRGLASRIKEWLHSGLSEGRDLGNALMFLLVLLYWVLKAKVQGVFNRN